MSQDIERRIGASSTAGHSKAERNPSALGANLESAGRLDEGFLTFLSSHVSSPSLHPNLKQYIRAHEILNPFSPGNKLDTVTRFFLDHAEAIRPWIADDSPLKDKLREYPGVYGRLWRGEEDLVTGRRPGVKRRGNEDAGDVEEQRDTKRDDDGSPGRATAKRRRLSGSGATEYDSLFGSPYESAVEGPGRQPGGVVRYTAGHPVIEAIYREYTAAGPSGVQRVSRDEPPITSPNNLPLTNAPPEVEEGHPAGGEEQGEGEGGETSPPPVYTPPSTPPASEPDNPEGPISPVDTASPSPPFTAATIVLPAPQTPSPPPPSPSLSPRLTINPHPPPPPSPSPQPRARLPSPPPRVPAAAAAAAATSHLPPRLGWEWSEDTRYRGTRQPPLAVRLEHALNFLREEDGDRCVGFWDKVREIDGWIAWIESGGGEGGDGDGWGGARGGGRGEGGRGRGYLARAGGTTREMVREVRRMIRGHRLFEREKYGVAQPGEGIKGHGEMARPRRGERVGVGREARGLQIAEEAVVDDGPRSVLVARPMRVNTQFRPADAVDDEEAGEVEFFLKRLNENEKAFWNGEADGRREYLFRLEDAAYKACSRQQAEPSVTSRPGRTLEGKSALALPAWEELPAPEGEESAIDRRLRRRAVERGARRAALQRALRCFTNTEQTLATTEWNRVVPPVEEDVLEEVRRDLGRNHQWQPARLDAPVRLETMPFTVAWRLHRKLLADLGENVRTEVNERNKNTPGWVTVPKGAAYGGPFLWRMVGPETQEQQDLLDQCEAVFQAIMRTPETTGNRREESILAAVKQYARNAADGWYGTSGTRRLPRGLEPRHSDRTSSEGHPIHSVSRKDMAWLEFLTSKSVNKEMLEATGRSQPKLYSIFAARLEKAMDDRSDEALFLQADQWRTIEELLPVINRGCDYSGKSVQFSPFQARYFLERAQDDGICRYKFDALVYGLVARSVRDTEPPERVQVPAARTPSDDTQAPLLVYPRDIRPFSPPPMLSPAERPIVKEFFHYLALRLGVTIFRLRNEHSRWSSGARLSHRPLNDALHTFQRAYRHSKNEFGSDWPPDSPGSGLSLAKLVKDLDPDVWAKYIHTVGVVRKPSGQWTPEEEDAAKEATALGIIRHQIIKENHENLTMLGRGRQVTFMKPDGSIGSASVRDHSWDWASGAVGGRAKRFFGLDRWPLELQSEETRGKIQSDGYIDPDMVFDPVAEDPIPREYFRVKLRRYGEEERLRRRPGPAIYPIGDTPLQRRMVRGMLADRMATAAGVYPAKKSRTWKEMLGGIWQSRRAPSPDHLDTAETSLPEVDPPRVPASWTPPANALGSGSAGGEVSMEGRDSVLQSIEAGDDVQMEDR